VRFFELKAFANKLGSCKVLCLLMALMLTASNMAFSAHVSSHKFSDASLCSLCVHPGGPDTAIAHEASPVFVSFTIISEALNPTSTQVSQHAFCSHQSRAPPRLT
jgi:hypothetical protein